MKNLIVRGVTRKTRERGYVDPVEERVNQLGYKGLFGFVVLEEEVVPADIVISMGAFGDAGRSWSSKFENWIPQKRGGRAEQFREAK